MLAFLSPGWLAALDDAARGDAALARATEGVDLVVEQRVTGGPGGEVVYHVELRHGHASVVAGPAVRPSVRFTQDHATARAVAAGTESAQRAFMAGQVQVGGDLRALLEHQEALAALGDVFADVRARTDLSAPADGATGGGDGA